MISKTSMLFLAVIFLFANTQLILGQSQAVTGDRRAKEQVNKIGTGKRDTVFLKDGTRVKGSIGQILDDSFDVTPEKQTQSKIISYRDVENVKKRGWSTTSKVVLWVGVGAVVVVVVLATVIANSEFLPGLSIGN